MNQKTLLNTFKIRAKKNVKMVKDIIMNAAEQAFIKKKRTQKE